MIDLRHSSFSSIIGLQKRNLLKYKMMVAKNLRKYILKDKSLTKLIKTSSRIKYLISCNELMFINRTWYDLQKFSAKSTSTKTVTLIKTKLSKA